MGLSPESRRTPGSRSSRAATTPAAGSPAAPDSSPTSMATASRTSATTSGTGRSLASDRPPRALLSGRRLLDRGADRLDEVRDPGAPAGRDVVVQPDDRAVLHRREVLPARPLRDG